MNVPKLKHPRLCRILTYVVVLGAFIAPIAVIVNLPLPDLVKVPIVMGLLVGCAAYIFKNFMILMMMDMVLASFSCYQTARTLYHLPKSRTAEAIRHSVLCYGKDHEPAKNQPQPAALRYKHSNSMTVYAKGIERVVAAYEVDRLDEEEYRQIFSSAKANGNALSGKKKFVETDPSQRKAPVHRVTVILILAHEVDPALTTKLYQLVCKRCGDESSNCIVPCVVDLSQNTCVFNCLRVPYVGFEYAVKNRGIRMVKKLVFGGNLNLKASTAYAMHYDTEYTPEHTLWQLWSSLRHEIFGTPKENQKQFKAMEEKEIRVKKEALYLKWDHRGVCLSIDVNKDRQTVKVESVTDWSYPKERPIAKTIIGKIEEHIRTYYQALGFQVEFTDIIGESFYVCQHILEENEPILYVHRDGDGDWRCLCKQDCKSEDGQWGSVFALMEHDPSAEQILGLKSGQSATRKSDEDDWIIQ